MLPEESGEVHPTGSRVAKKRRKSWSRNKDPVDTMLETGYL